MPANLYNKINQQQRQGNPQQQNAQQNNNNNNNNNSNNNSSAPVSDGKVHEATIVNEQPNTERQVPKVPKGSKVAPTQRVNNKLPLGVNVGLGIIDVIGQHIEQQHGVQDLGIYDYLKPHVHEVIKESPLRNVPDGLVGIFGKLLLKKLGS